MPAEVLSLDDFPEKRPNSRFVIPLVSSIEKYIKEKMKWPDEFCKYYSEKFWNHYQSQGWVLSNGNPMKDWRAAFNSQWQTPKHKEDQEKLKECLAAEKKDPIKALNEYLDLHRFGKFKPSRELCLGIYDYLKANNRMKLPKETCTQIVESAGNSRERGKMLAVRALFDKYIQEQKTFI